LNGSIEVSLSGGTALRVRQLWRWQIRNLSYCNVPSTVTRPLLRKVRFTEWTIYVASLGNCLLPLNYTREGGDFMQVRGNTQINSALTGKNSADTTVENTG
jgi:hypothetical protein